MLSDLGNPQVTVGQQPVVDQSRKTSRTSIAQPRPHRDDIAEQGAGSGRQAAAEAAAAAGAERRSGRAGTGRRDHSRAAAMFSASRPRPSCRRQLEQREKQAFEQAAQQIREAVGNDPQLAELARQLAIDMTPEGLRIQIRDADREPMFPLGSAVPNDKAQAAAAEGGAGAGAADAGHLDRRPYRRGAVCRLRPHQLGTLRRPRQRHAAAADRVRPAGDRASAA